MAWAAFGFGAVVPFAALLVTAWRGSRAVLRAVGGLVLLGAWLHLVWIVTPLSAAYGLAMAGAALAALLLGALAALAWGLR